MDNNCELQKAAGIADSTPYIGVLIEYVCVAYHFFFIVHKFSLVQADPSLSVGISSLGASLT